MSVLDGMAEWDDFDVYVDGTLVYQYQAQGGDPEDWIPHTIDLTPFEMQCCGPHTIKIDCVNGPWEYFNPYGQLAVDTIALYCEPEGAGMDPILCDSVDIGNPTSEMGHNLVGWGPIEPATSGGGYGGINDCRPTWFYEDPQNDASWAEVTLTCEDCYEPPVDGDCDCELPPMDLPFYMEPDSEMTICICYHLDMQIQPGVYTLYHRLIPSVV
jgi:hypothetical protein